MNTLKNKIFKSYGMQKKILKYFMILLTFGIFLSALGIGIVAYRNVKQLTLEKYQYVNEKTEIEFSNFFDRSDELMKECITNDDFQKSLLNREMTVQEKNSLTKTLSYIDFKFMDNYVYIDNKNNIYSKSYQKLNYDDFIQENFFDALGKEYSKTKFIWKKDTIFKTQKKSLFIGRFIYNMNYSHKPGVLFFKMNNLVFEDILERINNTEVAYLFLNSNGEICYSKFPNSFTLSQKSEQYISSQILENENMYSLAEGIVLSKYHQKSGFTVVTLIPNTILNKITQNIIFIMALIYCAIVLAAFIFSFYFSKRLTKPIEQINYAMANFKGNNFSNTLQLQTNTELDTIGQSYNKMLLNIQQLMEEIKNQERELRTSELNSLIYQINPHFLYNTLDTIYMLARINKEETTMKMIQALSKFLKVSLSKGKDIIPISDEIEHVKSYMEIQKIRNDNLFTYEINCNQEVQSLEILKLILQPLVENSIKYGFCEIYEGGLIKINIFVENEILNINVFNNGTPIDDNKKQQINSMMDMDLKQIKNVFSGNKNGYGISNIMSRLRLKYGNNINFYFDSDNYGTTCVIKIPVDDLNKT